ncbi:coiled-coil domain-containing protein 186 isoform X2 [Octopus sinensis]|nr:coiled-coil domain-containing protein 186 isoform X2 [Octopus sinensis]XP_029644778.1 coiled-coil domain-containing protein 186 isoform X2 [Octopus sinensis]
MCDTDAENNNVVENPDPEADSADVLVEDELAIGDDVEADIRGVPAVDADFWPQDFEDVEALIYQQVENAPDSALNQQNNVQEGDIEVNQERSDSFAEAGNLYEDNNIHIQPFLPVSPESVADTAPEDEILENTIRDSEERSEDFEPECDQAIVISDEDNCDNNNCDNVAQVRESVEIESRSADNLLHPALVNPNEIATKMDEANSVPNETNNQPLAADYCVGVEDDKNDAASTNEHSSSLQQLAVTSTNNNTQSVTQSTTSGDLQLESGCLSPELNKSANKSDETGDSSSISVTAENKTESRELIPSKETIDTQQHDTELVNSSTNEVASSNLEDSQPVSSGMEQQKHEPVASANHLLNNIDVGYDAVSWTENNNSELMDNKLDSNNTTPIHISDTNTANTCAEKTNTLNISPSVAPVHSPDLRSNQDPNPQSCHVANIECEQTETVKRAPDSMTSSSSPVPDQTHSNVSTEDHDGKDDQLLNELEEELLTTHQPLPQSSGLSFNGLTKIDINQIPEFLDLKQNFQSLKKELAASKQQIKLLESQSNSQQEKFEVIKLERNSYRKELDTCSDNDLYLTQLKALEDNLVQKDNEIRAAKEKLSSQEMLTKKTISDFQNEYKNKIHQLTKIAEENKREKEEMVIKYAQAERKGLEMQKGSERLDARLRESSKEKEILQSRLNNFKAERQKYIGRLESKSADFIVVQREVEKQKEALSACEGRLKWTQNKLGVETDAHKETKASLQILNTKLKESKEECEQIRRDCQAIIRTYQESEEIKSNSLDNQLKAKQVELKCHEQERSDHQQIHQTVLKELELLKTQHKDLMEEMKTKKDKIICLEDECRDKEDTLSKFKDVLQNQKARIKELKTKLLELQDIKSSYDQNQEELSAMQDKLSEQSQQCTDIKTDIESCKVRESELLELTANLSAKNAHLQSENITVNNKVLSLEEELNVIKVKLEESETKCQELHKSLEEETQKRQEETTTLTTQLADKSKSVEELGVQLEEAKDDIRTLKRKHTNNIKDLTRQLTFTRRKLENYENTGEKDSTSLGSRTSSNGSLNTLDNNVQSTVIHRNGNPDQEYPVITEQVEVDKQVLIERIVKLQKAHARKNDKIEFMEDHINHLVDEIQKKKRIIQSYALREETGVLSTDYMDINKAVVSSQSDIKPSQNRFYDQVSQLKAILSRKGGIMASLYNSQPADQSMTLDLSLEINKKLQSVLEDTLLKNITLKDSLDTLGKEISRLSRENRKLQLEQQSQ